jgi:uncharacterized protein with HEPN domain
MKDDLAFIEHILLCIDKIQQYTKNITLQDFNNNELIQDAVIRNIEIIGEATKKISKDLKSQYHEIPWKEISGMRISLFMTILELMLMCLANCQGGHSLP